MIIALQNLLQRLKPQLLQYRIKLIKALTGFSILFLFWLFCLHYNDSYHFSVSRNYISGELKGEKAGGLHFSAPWVQVIKFDTRPFKVCLDCSCRNTNCKLIAFNPNGWKDFIDREGIKYYWFANRLSFNIGQDQEYRGIHHVLRGYAYDNEYSFITVLNDIK